MLVFIFEMGVCYIKSPAIQYEKCILHGNEKMPQWGFCPYEFEVKHNRYLYCKYQNTWDDLEIHMLWRGQIAEFVESLPKSDGLGFVFKIAASFLPWLEISPARFIGFRGPNEGCVERLPTEEAEVQCGPHGECGPRLVPPTVGRPPQCRFGGREGRRSRQELLR